MKHAYSYQAYLYCLHYTHIAFCVHYSILALHTLHLAMSVIQLGRRSSSLICFLGLLQSLNIHSCLSFVTPVQRYHRQRYGHTDEFLNSQRIASRLQLSRLSKNAEMDLKKYKTRSEILQQTLLIKKKESESLSQKLEILQDVVKKLQASNKKLIEQLEQEKNSSKIVESSSEEMSKMKKDYEKALRIAHSKMLQSKQENDILTSEITTLEEKLKDYEEKSIANENDIASLKKEMESKESLILELNEKIKELEQALDEQVQNMSDTLAKQDAADLDQNLSLKELETLSEQVESLTAQNVQLKNQLKDLGDKWKSRRVQLESEISKMANLDNSLQTKVEKLEQEKTSVEKQLENTSSELKSLQSTSEAEIMEKEELAKQLSKESLEIATAAVRQAEEREMKLKKKLKRSQKTVDDISIENEELKERIEKLTEDLRAAKGASYEQAEVMAQTIDALQSELLNNTRIYELTNIEIDESKTMAEENTETQTWAEILRSEKSIENQSVAAKNEEILEKLKSEDTPQNEHTEGENVHLSRRSRILRRIRSLFRKNN